MIHFEALAKEYGLDESDTYIRFRTNMGELGYTYNVQLEDEDAQAEYDAIVITPYGMFVVEMKNWGAPMTISPNGLLTRNDDSGIVYDLPGRMSVKEALLREHLQELFPKNYHNMLLLSNERAQVQDNYHQISVSYGGGISYEIKSYGKSGNTLTEEQVTKIADTILANHNEQRALCSVRCEEIIADYAKLMFRLKQHPTERLKTSPTPRLQCWRRYSRRMF